MARVEVMAVRRLLFTRPRAAARDGRRSGLRRSAAPGGGGLRTAGGDRGSPDALLWLVVGLGIGAGLRRAAARHPAGSPLLAGAQPPAGLPGGDPGVAAPAEAALPPGDVQVAAQPADPAAFLASAPVADPGSQERPAAPVGEDAVENDPRPGGTLFGRFPGSGRERPGGRQGVGSAGVPLPLVRVYQEVPGPDGPIYVDSSGQVVSVSFSGEPAVAGRS